VYIYAASAIGWNLFSGLTGYVSLVHGAFFGIGAYAFAMMAEHSTAKAGLLLFGFVPVAALVASIVAIPVGLVAVRVKQHTFVVLSVAIFYLFQQLAFNLGFTGGSGGLTPPSPAWSGAFFNLVFLLATACIVAVSIVMQVLLMKSVFGLRLRSVKDDEQKLASLGVNVYALKVTAMAISAVPLGLAGAVYAFYLGNVLPQFAFDPALDLAIVVVVYLGGTGTVVGPLLGALIIAGLSQWMNSALPSVSGNGELLGLGAILLVVLYLLPSGLVPSLARVIVRGFTSGGRTARPGESDASEVARVKSA
jgi:branched-chain amino acid transport system permease protein